MIHFQNSKINKINLKFILSRISFLLQDFNLNILSSNNKEIKIYSNFIYKHIELFKKINKFKLVNKKFYFQNRNYFINEKKNIIYRLIQYRTSEVRKIIKKLSFI